MKSSVVYLKKKNFKDINLNWIPCKYLCKIDSKVNSYFFWGGGGGERNFPDLIVWSIYDFKNWTRNQVPVRFDKIAQGSVQWLVWFLKPWVHRLNEDFFLKKKMFLENEGFNKNIMIYFGEKFPWGIKKYIN